MMNYKDAVIRAKKLNEYAKEFRHENVQYIIVPADHQEMQTFLNDFYRSHNEQSELNCEEYCTNGSYLVYRIDNLPENKREVAGSISHPVP
ncbi:hypothetical protein NZ698_03615 [Chryseobacterium sp. PBS4-4]|uniref:Uncharacterized protein n=1 Tax=Chryseobacterium edaphi TaxID=2976532 RepID=A0ABT2W220_9FLAO|nr:hypothetical protein [Chryseobacterium edaphi]MCU7616272.1 hypothetical protein [Chryseobacterium edaphi]